jgi:hypothetical protein
MKKTRISFVLLLWASSFQSFSQTDIPLFNYTGTEFKGALNKFVSQHNILNVYISNHVAKNNFGIREICHEGITFIRFKFDSLGKLKQIGCSITTPPKIAKAFKDAVQASEEYWVHEKEVPVNERWYVQPVVYTFGINCKKKETDLFSLKGGPFRFDDNSSVTTLECVMFEPWITSSGVDEVDLVPPPKN